MTIILGIETSCDETAAAVVVDGRRILSNVVFTQEELHQSYGGVVPEVAARQHLVGILPAVERALHDSGVALEDLDAVAVSHGPGLAGSLLVGVNAAKGIAFARGLRLVGVNHLEGHIYANWLLHDAVRGDRSAQRRPPQFPMVCLIVSGGHTELVLMAEHGSYRLLGRTRDDAAGEAFDKAARMLGLGYPGGPAIERAAERAPSRRGHAAPPAAFQLTRPWLRGTYDFSFSGLKTAVLRLAESQRAPVKATGRAPTTRPSDVLGSVPVSGPEQAPLWVTELAASFQQAVVDVLVGKTVSAAAEFRARQIALAGGVAANRLLREQLSAQARAPVICPPIPLCTDNAAMVAAAAYYRLEAGEVAGWDLDVNPNLRLPYTNSGAC